MKHLFNFKWNIINVQLTKNINTENIFTYKKRKNSLEENFFKRKLLPRRPSSVS